MSAWSHSRLLGIVIVLHTTMLDDTNAQCPASELAPASQTTEELADQSTNRGEQPASTAKTGLPSSFADAALDVEDLELQPGLVGTYRTEIDAAPEPSVTRVDSKPSFSLTEGTLHPRIKPGAFVIVWSGIVQLRELDQIRFGAYLRGRLQVRIGGMTVLQAASESMTQRVENERAVSCTPGFYPIQIAYRSLSDLPARLQIWWEGKTFSRETLPSSRLYHTARESADRLGVEQARETGRVAAQQLGCASCHRTAFPASADISSGPALFDLSAKVERRWLLQWLANPGQLREKARMPVLFSDDRRGYVERSIVADFLLQDRDADKPDLPQATDADLGRVAFIKFGCAACHQIPGSPSTELTAGRVLLTDLGSRTTAAHLVRFLREPQRRYPDGRMPNFRLSLAEASNIAAFLLRDSPVAALADESQDALRTDEIEGVLRELGVESIEAAGKVLVNNKGCTSCHPGFASARRKTVSIRPPNEESWETRGCLSGKTLPRFRLDDDTRTALEAFLRVARQERHPSGFERRRQLLTRLSCAQCHQRDVGQRPMIEQVAQTIWIKSKHFVYQRTPSLSGVLEKYRLDYLRSAISAGVSGQRPKWYSYRMPAFNERAGEILRALAESDGEHLPALQDPVPDEVDPNVRDFGHLLVGFEGYSCVSCHVWKGNTLRVVEPSAAGPELTTVTKRIRRDWFDRWLENPLRIHPRTPMPAVFRKGQPATISDVLEGDPERQKDALWRYLGRGQAAPDPRRKPPFTLAGPARGVPPQVAQIPLRTPELALVESISILNDYHDLVVYDVAQLAVHNVYTRAELVCTDGYGAGRNGYFREFSSRGKTIFANPLAPPRLQLILDASSSAEDTVDRQFLGYERQLDGVRIRSQHRFPAATVGLAETLKIDRTRNQLTHRLRFSSIPVGASLRLRLGLSDVRAMADLVVTAQRGRASKVSNDRGLALLLDPDPQSHQVDLSLSLPLPPGGPPVDLPSRSNAEQVVAIGDEFFEQDRSRLERPGYRAIRYPRPQTAVGEDLVMPYSLAADPKTGRLYVASNKFGELFRLDDPNDDGRAAQFIDYTRGRFQDVFGLHHDGRALYVLHRRNLTKVRDTDGDGTADQFERVAQINHAVAEQYDWAYGLVRDRQGRFLVSLAPFGNAHQTGAGSVLRLPERANEPIQEVAFGLRNPFGWSTGPDGEVFFTDNQGNWVETNKLCHLESNRFYGFVNQEQPEHRAKQRGSTAVWIPYRWAQSINGVTYDNTAGKFGPFAGQFFLAELMRGGAIVRASLEKVNGVYQGACFPFWGKGLMGPLALCFDRRGRLYVGSITEPGWMSQPDRGGLFRIDFTHQVPFEMQTIRVRPRGFRLRFTKPVSAQQALATSSYRIEHYRYEYSSDYGSPELDRAHLAIHKIELADDRRTVELETGNLASGRVYEITAAGVLSHDGDSLVHETGVYTLNEIPNQ